MDPLSVLGLVSNIVQLVGAVATAYRICCEIHQSGAPVEDSRMLYTTGQLHESCDVLTQSLRASSSTRLSTGRTSVDLDVLGSRCCETATALQKILESLRKTPGKGLRESLSKFVKRLSKVGTIEGLKEELDEQDLETLKTQRQQHDVDVEQQLRQLATNLETCISSPSDQLKAEIDIILKADETQHGLTRQQAKQNVTDAILNLEISREQRHRQEKIEQERHHQRSQILKSLMFDEINSRMNDVSEPHPETFKWIFDHSSKRPWDSFAEWLKDGEDIFWISGKAGSGKSTLMKFIVGNPKLKRLLNQWSSDSKVLVVTFYLWLSGSKIQRSQKGFLCSIIRQILLSDEHLFEELVCKDAALLLKYSINDWSNEELRQLLKSLTKLSQHTICLIIDGLDEFDREDNVHGLLDFMEELCIPKRVKICASSRPEQLLVKRLSRCKQIRLQDLTAKDIEACIRDELEKARIKCAPASFDEAYREYIVKIMKEKADGVFLWVYYALSSLLRGLENEDGFGVLLGRIKSLPSGMHDLYLQMWKRLNGDEKFYLDEATTFFSYDIHYPMSLFKLKVALDKPLQDNYITAVKPQDPTILVKDCDLLKTRILTRCAGLLELGQRRPELAGSLPEEDSLIPYQMNWYIGYLHRTARDFLFTTAAGQALIGIPTTSNESRLRDVVNANLAAVIQGLLPFCYESLESLISKIARFGPRDEVDLLVSIKRTYKKLGMPESAGKTGLQRQREGFWLSANFPHFENFTDFECIAAFHLCMAYIQHFVENEIAYLSPYYCGLLALCATFGIKGTEPHIKWTEPDKRFFLVSWLGAHGADLFTSHVLERWILTPLGQFLGNVLYYHLFGDVQLAKRAIETIQTLLSHGKVSVGSCLTSVSPEDDWRVLPLKNRFIIRSPTIIIIMRMSMTKLCKLAIEHLEKHFSIKPQWHVPFIDEEDVSEVLFRTDQIAYERTNGRSQGHFFVGTDPTDLGQTLDKILFHDEDSLESRDSLIAAFDDQMREAIQRGIESRLNDWEVKIGWKIKDPKTICALDPAEDVDATNWQERGYFRYRTAQSRSHNAETTSENLEREEDEDFGLKLLELGKGQPSRAGG